MTQEWYHGSTSPTPVERFERREKGPYETHGPRDWNTRLGSHWSSDHQVAHDFTPKDGTVHHARLDMKNPKVYEHEYDLGDHAHRWARENGFNEIDHRPKGHPQFEGRPYLDPDNEGEGPLPHLDLREHPRGDEIADGFKAHLKSQGHDGIIYGNAYEGEEEHPCAIPFEHHQIHVTAHHKPGACQHGLAQAEWDDEAGDYKTSVLSFEAVYAGFHERAADGPSGQPGPGLGQPRGGVRGPASAGVAGAAGLARGAAGGPGGLTLRHEVVGGYPRLSLHGDDPESQHEYGDFRPGEMSYIEYTEHKGRAHINMRETREHLEGQGLQHRLQDALHKIHPEVISHEDEMSDQATSFRHKYLDSNPHANWRMDEGEHPSYAHQASRRIASAQPNAAGVTWHPKAAKDLKALDRPVQKQVLQALDGITSGHPTTLAQTHPLNGVMKGWYATKVSRGHRIIHQPTADGGVHIGYVGLHEYEKAIQRLASLTVEASSGLWPKHPVFRPGDHVLENTPNGKQYPAKVHHQEESHDPDHHGQVWIQQKRDWGDGEDMLVGVHPSRLSLHPDAPAEAHEYHRQQKALNEAGVPYVPEHEKHIDDDDRVTVHHLTDKHDFTPDATVRPQNNTTMGGSLSPRLFVGSPTAWAEGEHGYRRPYVAEMSVPKGALRNAHGYLGENEIPARHFDKVHVKRVLPYSEHLREQEEPGYHSSVDTRTWSAEQHRDHLKAHREHLHANHGWGWNEFDKDHNHVGLGDDDWDEHMVDPSSGYPGTYVRRDKKGRPMTTPRSSH